MSPVHYFDMKKLIAYIDEHQFTLMRSAAYTKAVTLSCIIRWCIDDYIRSNKHLFSDFLNDPEMVDYLKFINKRSYRPQAKVIDPEILKSLAELTK